MHKSTNIQAATRRIAVTLVCWAICLGITPAQALDAVTLQLKWTHAFQFAGYYAAIEKGYYRAAGLDVRLVEAQPGTQPVDTLMSGAAQYGVGTSSLLLDRHAGRPVVALAAIFQHSPQVLIANLKSPAPSIHDLKGKRIMVEPQADELLAQIQREGVGLDQIIKIHHSFDVRDLLIGQTDAISAYSTNEPFLLQQAGFRYQMYTPRSSGIDFYGDTLFTSEQELRDYPKRVEAFVAASRQGWKYAMEHTDEIIDLILARYPTKLSREHLRFEAVEMKPLLRTDLIEVGYMNPGRWRHIAETYADLGLLPHNFSLDGFLYKPDRSGDFAAITRKLMAALAVAMLLGLLATYVIRINRRLQRSLTELQRTTSALDISLRDLKTAEAEQRNLLAVASHEFRTPAAMIKASLDSMRFLNDQITPAVATRLENITHAANRLHDLANRLIAEDRLQEQSLQPNLESVDLNAMVAVVLSTQGKDHRIDRKIPGNAVIINADPTLLRIALHNLIDNALAHNPPGIAPLSVMLALDGEHVDIRVADQGDGIPDEKKQRIFERFYSSSGDLCKGLGLSIVRTIARAHGGDVFVLDNTPRGAIMVLRLPYR